jgi:hypothetical protein
VRKTANILNTLPKSVQPTATQMLQAMWMVVQCSNARRHPRL